MSDRVLVTYKDALEVLTESMCNFGDDGIADDLTIAVELRYPEVNHEMDDDWDAEDIRRTTVILDALRLATTQYEAKLAGLQEEQA